MISHSSQPRRYGGLEWVSNEDGRRHLDAIKPCVHCGAALPEGVSRRCPRGSDCFRRVAVRRTVEWRERYARVHGREALARYQAECRAKTMERRAGVRYLGDVERSRAYMRNRRKAVMGRVCWVCDITDEQRLWSNNLRECANCNQAAYRNGRCPVGHPLTPLVEGCGRCRENERREAEETMQRGQRERLPKTRRHVTYKLKVGGHSFYVTLGLYPDGRVGEVWIDLSKEGSALRTAVQSWAKQVSKSIQYGMPVREIAATYRGVKSEPNGRLICEDVAAVHGQNATSIYDAVARLVEAESDQRGVHIDFPDGAPVPIEMLKARAEGEEESCDG